MPKRLPAPTKEQQGHLRAKAMQIAGIGLAQMREYLETGFISVANNEPITMTNERLNTIRTALNKCLPDMHHSEVQKTNKYEGASTEELIASLAKMAQERPQLARRLNDVLGGKVIEGEKIEDPA